MFNMLNRSIQKGKNSPLMCKFADSVSAFFHEIDGLCGSRSYLLERMDFRDCLFPPFGFRIALTIGRPVLLRFRGGKD
jgi:hypothetical protein